MAWKYRQVQVEDDLAIADSGTKTFDIDLTDPITALILRFKVANGASAVKEQPPENYITRVELIDGGQIYWSLPGPHSVAASTYFLGRWPHHFYDERANNNQRINFTMPFGRFLGDEQYAFTPTKLANPQLRLTWTDNASYADGSYTFGITAQIMEGLTPPAKMLAWQEIEPWTTAASGVHKTQLPTDYTYRALMMRAYATGGIQYTIHTHYKLDIDTGKFIPLDLDHHEFRDLTKQQFGPYQVFYHLVESNNVQVESWLGECCAASGSHQTTPPSIIALYSAGAWPIFFVYGADHTGSPITDALIEATAWGFYPHSCYLWPFGRWMDPETWFDPRTPVVKTLDLKITEATAGASASVCAQRVRPLP